MRHVAVIVEVITGQVGKGCGGDRQAVEAKLGETMARRLDCHMFDPLYGEGREITVEGDRVGRRQRARPSPVGGYKPECANADRGMTGGCPDFSREMDYRGVAICAGH